MVNTKFVFPYQLHRMLEDAQTQGFEHIISWVHQGNNGSSTTTNCFKIHDSNELEATILPMYLPGQTKYKSFLRQLNIYGFTRTTTSTSKMVPPGSYTHPLFVRYQLHLCKNMVRCKIKGTTSRPSSKRPSLAK